MPEQAGIPAHVRQAADVLACAHTAAVLDEYGRCAAPGFRVTLGSENRVRVHHQLVPIDLTDPDRPGIDERWYEQGERVAEYAETLETAGWRVTRRVPVSGPILLATPPEPDAGS